MTPDGRGRDQSGQLLAALGARRPEPARNGTPPDDASLTRILEIATTVPDHGGLRPWRFAVVRGTGRVRFGDALVASLRAQQGADVPDAAVAKMHGKAFAAPCAVMLIASPRPGSNVPEWEQVASASCTGYAIVLAAVSLGFGAVWKSAVVLDSRPVRDLFGLEPHERLLGWVNLGSPAELGRKASDPPGAVLDGLVTVIDANDRTSLASGSAPGQ
ncbi:MAG: nitroreductase [Acidimicrobiales bacterium]